MKAATNLEQYIEKCDIWAAKWTRDERNAKTEGGRQQAEWRRVLWTRRGLNGRKALLELMGKREATDSIVCAPPSLETLPQDEPPIAANSWTAFWLWSLLLSSLAGYGWYLCAR